VEPVPQGVTDRDDAPAEQGSHHRAHQADDHEPIGVRPTGARSAQGSPRACRWTRNSWPALSRRGTPAGSTPTGPSGTVGVSRGLERGLAGGAYSGPCSRSGAWIRRGLVGSHLGRKRCGALSRPRNARLILSIARPSMLIRHHRSPVHPSRGAPGDNDGPLFVKAA
jgi:hypothetical protein